MIFLSYKKIYTRIIGIGRDLADVMERGKMDELCVCAGDQVEYKQGQMHWRWIH